MNFVITIKEFNYTLSENTKLFCEVLEINNRILFGAWAYFGDDYNNGAVKYRNTLSRSLSVMREITSNEISLTINMSLSYKELEKLNELISFIKDDWFEKWESLMVYK